MASSKEQVIAMIDGLGLTPVLGEAFKQRKRIENSMQDIRDASPAHDAAIFELHNTGELSYGQLAKVFGVERSTVSYWVGRHRDAMAAEGTSA